MSSPSRQPGGRVEQASEPAILRNHKRRIEILEALQSNLVGTGGYMTVAEQFDLRGAWLCQEPSGTAGTDSPEDGVHNTARSAGGFLARVDETSPGVTMAAIIAAQAALDDSVPMFNSGYDERRGFTHLGDPATREFVYGPGGQLLNCVTFHPYLPWPSNSSVPQSEANLPPDGGGSGAAYAPDHVLDESSSSPSFGSWTSLPDNPGADTIANNLASGLEPFTISGWVWMNDMQQLTAGPIWDCGAFSIYLDPIDPDTHPAPSFDFILKLATFIKNQNVQIAFTRRGVGGPSTTIRGSIRNTQWVMLTCVYDGALMSLYANGMLVTQDAGSGGNIASAPVDYMNFGFMPGSFGGGGGSLGFYMSGHMAGVLYFRDALTAGEIASLYDSITLAPSGTGVFGPPASGDPDLAPTDAGYLYFNTTFQKLRLWTGTAWEQITSV